MRTPVFRASATTLLQRALAANPVVALLEPVLARFPTRDAYFWATHAGAELDLLLLRHGRRIGFEFKFSDAPGTTKSMRIALADLKLDHLWVVHPGPHRHPLDASIEAIGLLELVTSDENLA